MKICFFHLTGKQVTVYISSSTRWGQQTRLSWIIITWIIMTCIMCINIDHTLVRMKWFLHAWHWQFSSPFIHATSVGKVSHLLYLVARFSSSNLRITPHPDSFYHRNSFEAETTSSMSWVLPHNVVFNSFNIVWLKLNIYWKRLPCSSFDKKFIHEAHFLLCCLCEVT